MKMTLKKEVIMTEEERQALSSFLKMITSDNDIDIVASWDILTAIADCDYDLAKEYDYYIEIRG